MLSAAAPSTNRLGLAKAVSAPGWANDYKPVRTELVEQATGSGKRIQVHHR
jgi:hypothetical protein